MSFWNCNIGDLRTQIETAGFSKVNITYKELNFNGVRMPGPMKCLSPHVYGYNVKWDVV